MASYETQIPNILEQPDWNLIVHEKTHELEYGRYTTQTQNLILKRMTWSLFSPLTKLKP